MTNLYAPSNLKMARRILYVGSGFTMRFAFKAKLSFNDLHLFALQSIRIKLIRTIVTF